jgi:hypothetical protein
MKMPGVESEKSMDLLFNSTPYAKSKHLEKDQTPNLQYQCEVSSPLRL